MDESKVTMKGRLGPGMMISVDLRSGQVCTFYYIAICLMMKLYFLGCILLFFNKCQWIFFILNCFLKKSNWLVLA